MAQPVVIDTDELNAYKAGVVSDTQRRVRSSITVRNLDPALSERLRLRGARHSHSMKAEVRTILQTSLADPVTVPRPTPYDRSRARAEVAGGLDVALPSRQRDREPPPLD